jgi:hypothetical protein
MPEPSAIQNMDFLRQLLERAKQDPQIMDMLRLRMLQGSGLGLDAVARLRGDQ